MPRRKKIELEAGAVSELVKSVEKIPVKEAALKINLDENSENSDMPNDPLMKARCAILGANIRRERKSRGFTREDLSDMVHLSVSYLGLIERGQRSPSLKSLFAICDLFGVSLDEILREHDIQEKSLRVAEGKKKDNKNSFETATALLRTLNEQELEFAVSMLSGMKKVAKKGGSFPLDNK